MNPIQSHSTEAEQSLLGGLMLEPAAIVKIPTVRESHFYHQEHATIFRAIHRLQEKRKDCDLISVQDELGDDLALVGSFDYLLTLAQTTPSAANIVRYAQIVMEHATAREAVRMAQEFSGSLNSATAQEQIAAFASKLTDLASDDVQNDNETYTLNDLIRVGIENFGSRWDSGGAITGLTSGFAELDKLTGGFQGGGLYVMAGRPAMGKTAASMTLAAHAAKHAQGAVWVFTMEMSQDQLAMRSLAMQAGASLDKLQRGDGADGEVLSAFDKNLDYDNRAMQKMVFDLRAGISIAQMRAKAQQVKTKQGLSMIVVDYLGLIGDGGRRFSGDTERVTWLSRQVKLMAKDFNVPVLLLAQLNRDVEKRQDKRPLMSDLRDSGAIEQDADMVILNYRDAYYSKSETDDVFEMIVAKNRMGIEKTVYAQWQGQYSRIVDLGSDWVTGALLNRERDSRTGGRKL